MHKIKNHIHNLVIFLSHAIYLHTSNQIASLVNQAKSMQSTKHDKSHALSLSHVSQALRYEPDSASTRTKQARRNRAFSSGQGGAVQARARELHERTEQQCKASSCA